MRRDLLRGCSTCRLRFSSALTSCPACGRDALSAPAALEGVAPATRATWLGKWAIAIALVVGFAFTLYRLRYLFEGLRPVQGAHHVVVHVALMLGVFTLACLILAIPLAVWAGIVLLLRRKLGRRVDQNARALRIALDRARRPPRKKSALRAVLGKLAALHERARARKWTLLMLAVAVLLLVEIVVDCFASDPVLDFSGPFPFLARFGTLLGLNVTFLVMAIVPASVCAYILGRVFDYFRSPPSLLGFEAPPPLLNEQLVSQWTEGRFAVVGRAEPLTEVERTALAERGGEDAPAELTAPFSGARCLAFRVTGERGAQPLDDADAVSFAVITGEGQRYAVHAGDVVVLLPARDEALRKGGGDFLAARGLAEGELSAQEGRLQAGDRVRVTGHLERVAAVGAGYRGASSLEVLLAGDGRPVVIEAPAG